MPRASQLTRVLVPLMVVSALAVGIWAVWLREPEPSETPPTNPNDLTLDRYSGRVVNALGQPIPGVEIKAENLPHAVAGRTQTISQRNGTFSIELPAGYRPRVSLKKSGYVVDALDLLAQGAQGSDSHDYLLRKSATLKGTILDVDGRPAPGVTVEIQSKGNPVLTTNTGPHGGFLIDAPPGQVAINVHSPRFADQTFTGIELSRSKPTQWEATVERGGGVRFRVIDDDQAMSGAKVSIRTLSGDVETATTDASGRAAINGLGGPIVEYAVIRSGYAAVVDRFSMDEASDVAELTIRLEPVEQTTLELSTPTGGRLDPGPYDRLRVTSRWHELVSTTIGDTRTRQVLGHGSYTFEITMAGRAPWAADIEVVVGVPIRITVPAGGRVRGVATDGDGKPASGATIFTQLGSSQGLGVLSTGRTTVAGDFATWLLPPGAVHLRIEHPTAGSWSKAIDVLDAQELDLGQITLKR